MGQQPRTGGTDALNDVAEALIESALAYEKAAEITEVAEVSSALRQLGSQRRGLARQVQSAVRSRGGEPVIDGSAVGAAHRAFMQVRAALGDATEAAVREAERADQTVLEQATSHLRIDTLDRHSRAVLAHLQTVLPAPGARVTGSLGAY